MGWLMVLADWTVSSGAFSLDAGTKRTGTSSLKCTTAGEIYHTGDSQTYIKVEFWHFNNNVALTIGMRHPSYGVTKTVAPGASVAWLRIEFWFWYDAPSNTKWCRKLVNGVPTGADMNCGAGAPGADVVYISLPNTTWIDDTIESW